MLEIVFVTGNASKFKYARDHLKIHSIALTQKTLEIPEIQSESIKEIAVDKAKKAYQTLKRPIIVSDHGWHILSLNGFPGAFMKYINHWLTSRDLLNLMKAHKNREILFEEVICFVDKDLVKVFTKTQKGQILHKSRGQGLASETIVTFDPNNLSIAEVNSQTGKSAIDQSKLWQEFAKWVNKYNTSNPELQS